MTVSELHTAFRLELDKSNSLSTTSFEPEEVDYWLNKAYLALVNQKMFGTNPRGEGFDMSQKREDDLRKLINIVYVAPYSGVSIKNAAYLQISTNLPNYLYLISSRTLFTNDTVSVNLNISNNEKGRFMESDSNTPWIKNPVAYVESDYLYILYDRYRGYGPGGIEVTYLRRPEVLSISVPSQVPIIAEHVHQEIASLAAYMAIENIESPRVQTNPLILNKLE